MRKELFSETYKILEEQNKDVFTEKWIEHIPEDLHDIYDITRCEVAERYLLADFACGLSALKEKLYAKLH